MKLRILTAVLAMLMLLGMLTACVNAPDDQGEQGSVNQSEQGDIYDQALSKLTVDWGKEDFVVLGRNDAANSIFEIACMETSTEPLEDSVYYRNLNLAERCNLNYIPKLVTTDELLNVIGNDIKSGSGEYAIAFPNMLNAGNLATKNMLVDFNTLEHIDLYAEWWDQGTLDISIAGKTFWMNSDINFLAHDVTFLTMFSKVMAEKQQLNDLYQTVHNQEWTVEVFSSYIKQVSSDANGDGRYDENDNYGLIGTSTMGYNMFYAADLKFVSCNEEGEPYLALSKTDLLKASDLLDQLLDIFYVGNCTYIVHPGGEQTAKNMFSRNQGLFYVECAGYVVNLRFMSDDFGVLPMPKYDKAQEKYTTYVHSISSTMVVPTGAKNFSDLSKVIETMAILSSESVMPTYYELVLKRKTIRDEESASMLDIIFSNRTYDLANYYENIGLMHTFQASVNAKTNNFASEYNRVIKKSEKVLTKLYKDYEELDG